MPSTICLKQDLSIDTTLDPSQFSVDSPFKINHGLVETSFRAAVPTHSSAMAVIIYMYSVQSPAIKAVLCIEIIQCCHSSTVSPLRE